MLIESGIVVDATTDDDEVTPGQELPVTLTVWNAGHDTAQVTTEVIPHSGFVSRPGGCAGGRRAVAPGALYSCTITMTVAAHAAPTSPYYLNLPLRGAMYQWGGDPSVWGEPSAPPLTARFAIEIPGEGAAAVTREVQARFRDGVLGEVRRPVMIVPRVAVDLQPSQVLWPSGQRSRQFTVALEHLSRDSMDATVSLAVPAGWTAGAPQHVHFSRDGERASVTFTVTAPLHVAPDRYHDHGQGRGRNGHVRHRAVPHPLPARAGTEHGTTPQANAVVTRRNVSAADGNRLRAGRRRPGARSHGERRLAGDVAHRRSA